MRTIKYITLLLIIVFSSCRQNCTVDTIEVSEILAIAAKDQGVNYCDLLESCLKNDKKAIKKISLLKLNGGASGYDHGAILVELILRIGEENFIKSISPVSRKEFDSIKSYIMAGLEYGNNPKIKTKNINIAFPILSKYLQK